MMIHANIHSYYDLINLFNNKIMIFNYFFERMFCGFFVFFDCLFCLLSEMFNGYKGYLIFL